MEDKSTDRNQGPGLTAGSRAASRGSSPVPHYSTAALSEDKIDEKETATVDSRDHTATATATTTTTTTTTTTQATAAAAAAAPSHSFDAMGGVKSPVRIAVYGGAFNPITNAHLNVAAEIIHSALADVVWIVPCGPRDDKPTLESYQHRLVMCHLAVDCSFGSRFPVIVSDIEGNFPTAIPSILLMRMLAAKHPEVQFSFVLGTDLVASLGEWTCPACPGHWDEVPDAGELFVEENNFLLIPRPGSELSEEWFDELPSNFQLISPAIKGATLVTTHLSSTEVRRRIRNGRASVDTTAADAAAAAAAVADVAADTTGATSKGEEGRSRSTHTRLVAGVKRGLTSAPHSKRLKAAARSVASVIRTPKIMAASADDDVRARMHSAAAIRSPYNAVEGLVPAAVLGHIVRYHLYAPKS